MRITLRIVALLLALVALCLGYTAARRLSMPYTEEGKYFDGVVVYERQAIRVYAALALIAGLSAAGLAAAARPSRPRPAR
jgi:hypothetical protein